MGDFDDFISWGLWCKLCGTFPSFSLITINPSIFFNRARILIGIIWSFRPIQVMQSFTGITIHFVWGQQLVLVEEDRRRPLSGESTRSVDFLKKYFLSALLNFFPSPAQWELLKTGLKVIGRGGGTLELKFRSLVVLVAESLLLACYKIR